MYSPKKQSMIIGICFLCAQVYSIASEYVENNSIYFCTAANSKYYWQTLNLIGSIHKLHFNELGEITVYNLGLTDQECETLNHIKKVKVREIEKTHPDIIKSFVTDPDGRTVPGWFAWKPVIIKQSLDLYPHVFYLDAGHVVLRRLDALFEYIKEHGYFICDNGCPLEPVITKFLLKSFNLEDFSRQWILSSISIDASKLGFSRDSSAYKDFVLPAYEMSKDLRYFEDDGSAKVGFGGARHDQTALTILAALLHLDILLADGTQRKPISLWIEDNKFDLFLTWRYDALSDLTHIYHCRRNWAPDFTGNIVWNK